MEDDEKELEHSSLQEKLDKELKELDKKLEQKEVKAAFAGFKLIKMQNPFCRFIEFWIANILSLSN